MCHGSTAPLPKGITEERRQFCNCNTVASLVHEGRRLNPPSYTLDAQTKALHSRESEGRQSKQPILPPVQSCSHTCRDIQDPQILFTESFPAAVVYKGSLPSISVTSTCRTGSGEVKPGLDLMLETVLGFSKHTQSFQICTAWHSQPSQGLYQHITVTDVLQPNYLTQWKRCQSTINLTDRSQQHFPGPSVET